MSEKPNHSREVIITNPLGFHVRPIQRFAELAQAFRGDVRVGVGQREASGKSMIGLMSLGAAYNSRVRIVTSGEDARQALDVLSFLVESDFFVEDAALGAQAQDRHVSRLVGLASLFDSDVSIEVDGRVADARRSDEVAELRLKPDSDVRLHIRGKDADQAHKVLGKLVEHRFYVEH